MPRIELFQELIAVLVGYPSEGRVKESIMEHLYELLKKTLDQDVRAMKLLAGRFMREDMKGEEFVEGMRCANEEMMKMARTSSRVEVLEAYAGFVEEWCGREIDASLVRLRRVLDEARRVTWAIFRRNTSRCVLGR